MNRVKGIIMIIAGAMLWGATGPMMEWILSTSGLSVQFMLTLRLIIAGLCLLGIVKLSGKSVLLPWRQKVWARQLLIFSVFGMLGVQYTFVASIATSNAVIATLFQFLAPILIIFYVSYTQRKWPPAAQIGGMAVTLIGLFFLLTNGSISGLALGPIAIAWGLALGFAFAFYTMYPVRVMKEWGVILPVGWGMVIGGLTLFVINPLVIFRDMHYLSDMKITLMLVLVIIVGTLAFVLFLGSMKYITPVETSILASFEPLTAMGISVLWFGQILGGWQIAGALGMLVGVTWLSIVGAKIAAQNNADSLGE